MTTRLSSLFSLSAVLALVPSAAFAATLTATQQGVVSASAPIGAQRAVFLELSLHAECDSAVTVNSLDIRHRGLGDLNDLARVYVTDGDVRLTHTRSLNQSGSPSSLTFYPALKVKPCETKKVQIRGDFSSEAQAAGEHGLIVDALDAGDAEVVLNKLSKVPTITAVPESVGNVRVELLGLNKAPRYGSTAVLARIRLSADGYKDQEVRSITLVNRGKASDDDLQNLFIRTSSKKAITDKHEALDGKRIRLTFSEPLFLQHNSTMLVELVGDVRASRSRTISFIIEEPSDVEAVPAAR